MYRLKVLKTGVVVLMLWATFHIILFMNDVTAVLRMARDWVPDNMLNRFTYNIEADNVTYPSHLLKHWIPMAPVRERPGEHGEGGLGVTMTPKQMSTMKRRFKENHFNILASDMISLNRSLPDVRQAKCKTKQYPTLLPTTSVVIVFHNEAWSTLLRTVWSVINRSPRSLLKEILLVDDASDRDFLGKKLEDYVATLPVETKVLRTGNRSGLIRARLLGAKHVIGEVITFLDAHCECADGWLEPLLARIVVDRKTVVCPVIDVISDDTFDYISASEMSWGGFNWKLNFQWYPVPQREVIRRNYDYTAPLRAPVMAGGLLSIDKNYFYEIGSYDEEMDIWGGENLEMSFRIWMCGGTLEILPCSHVGHVFRTSTPYSFPGGIRKTIIHNIARVAEVWLDEWKHFYKAMNPGVSVEVDVSKRLALRKKLECKSFRWYLENIYPESQMPFDNYYLGEIENVETGLCLDTHSHKSGEKVGMNYCFGSGENQVFAYTKRSQILCDDKCLDPSNTIESVGLFTCNGLESQEWIYDSTEMTIIHKTSEQCLEHSMSVDQYAPILNECDGSHSQKWMMKNEFHWKASSK